MEDQEVIDLEKIKRIIIKYKVRLAAIILVCTGVAIAVALNLPKEYESTTLLRAKSPKGSGISLQASSALAILGGGASASPTAVYMEMMKSRSVLDPVIADLDLPADKKGKIDAKNFSKSNIKITNTRGTDLLEVTGVGRTPEEAQKISSDVVKSFQQLLTKLNKSEQSLMVKFLNERMTLAKKDMEQAEQNLESFRQQEKVYIPTEQAGAIMKKLTESDQKMAQLQVQNDMNESKLQSIAEQLNKQNVAIARYNISDNSGIQQIRNNIIQKQMSLIDLKQRYTEKHPKVITLEKEIAELNSKLSVEIDNSIQSGTNTLNPVHAHLLKEKVQTETEILVGQAALGTIKKLQSENEKEISKLSSKSVTYIGLERQVKATQEVYAVLVKNYEQTRIQEAMESMDVQVIDEAELPKFPSAPKKTQIAAIGGVVGVMLSFIYIILLYIREKKYVVNQGTISR